MQRERSGGSAMGILSGSTTGGPGTTMAVPGSGRPPAKGRGCRTISAGASRARGG